MSFHHTAIKYKEEFSLEPYGSLELTIVIYFYSVRVLNFGSTGSFMTYGPQR